jgi:hypothetical protein
MADHVMSAHLGRPGDRFVPRRGGDHSQTGQPPRQLGQSSRAVDTDIHLDNPRPCSGVGANVSTAKASGCAYSLPKIAITVGWYLRRSGGAHAGRVVLTQGFAQVIDLVLPAPDQVLVRSGEHLGRLGGVSILGPRGGAVADPGTGPPPWD